MEWTWLSDGAHIAGGYENCAQNEPNAAPWAQCLAVQREDGKWRATSCVDVPMRYVCELPSE